MKTLIASETTVFIFSDTSIVCQNLNSITFMNSANYALAINEAESDATLAECVVQAPERMIT